jgi:hypothetical protein
MVLIRLGMAFVLAAGSTAAAANDHAVKGVKRTGTERSTCASGGGHHGSTPCASAPCAASRGPCRDAVRQVWDPWLGRYREERPGHVWDPALARHRVETPGRVWDPWLARYRDAEAAPRPHRHPGRDGWCSARH